MFLDCFYLVSAWNLKSYNKNENCKITKKKIAKIIYFWEILSLILDKKFQRKNCFYLYVSLFREQ